MTTKDEILEAIKGLSVLELSDLVKDIEEAFGVSAAAPVAVAAVASDDGGGAPEEEEQTEFNVGLKDFGATNIPIEDMTPAPKGHTTFLRASSLATR